MASMGRSDLESRNGYLKSFVTVPLTRAVNLIRPSAALSAVAWLMASTTARAQDTSELMQMPLEDLLSVSTVTASGGNIEERATASGNVLVISRQDIDNNGWHSVEDVLGNVP